MNFELARTQMLGQQLRAWEVLDDRVLRAFAETPRENFVPRDYRDLAFADTEIPLGHGQTMLAPKVEGRMLQALQVEPIDDVLVVGTGSGYLTACLARLAKRVHERRHFSRLRRRGARPRSRPAASVTSSSKSPMRSTCRTGAVRRDRRHGLDAGARSTLHRRCCARKAGCSSSSDANRPWRLNCITLQPNGTTTTDSLFETVLAPLINAERPEPFVL